MYDKRLDDCEHCRRPQVECICSEKTTEQKYKESLNNGGSTDYYKLPNGGELQDLIEYKKMNFAQGNIIKAIYRGGGHSSYERDLNKIIFFAERELQRLKYKSMTSKPKQEAGIDHHAIRKMP